MRRKIFVLMAMLALAACGNQNPAAVPHSPVPGLGQKDYEIMTQYNSAQEDAMAAARSAPGKPSIFIDQKLQKMMDAVKDSGCELAGGEPPKKFDQDWQSDLVVTSDSCALNFHKGRSFLFAKHVWKVNDALYANGKAMSDLTPLRRMSRAGQIEVLKKGTTTGVNGAIEYPQFVFAGLDGATAVIQTHQVYRASGLGGGYVSLSLTVGRTRHYTAQITWRLNQPPIYTLNSRTLDHKTFLALFSAYGLDEVMDVSMAMR